MEQKQYIIYKIICNTNDKLIYIGSTLNFRRRKWEHKSNSTNKNSNCRNYKLYKTIIENDGWNNWNMTPIEIFEADCNIKAKIRENELMEFYKSNLNSCKAILSEEERANYFKKYYDKQRKYYANIEDKKQYNKDSYAKYKHSSIYTTKVKCDCGIEILKNCLKNHLNTKKHQKYLCGLIKEEEKQAIEQV